MNSTQHHTSISDYTNLLRSTRPLRTTNFALRILITVLIPNI